MRAPVVRLAAIGFAALTCLHASAQSPGQPTVSTAATRPTNESAKPLAVATSLKLTAAPSFAAIGAASSIILLADGIVANASLADIRPPAAGFVYER